MAYLQSDGGRTGKTVNCGSCTWDISQSGGQIYACDTKITQVDSGYKCGVWREISYNQYLVEVGGDNPVSLGLTADDLDSLAAMIFTVMAIAFGVRVLKKVIFEGL